MERAQLNRLNRAKDSCDDRRTCNFGRASAINRMLDTTGDVNMSVGYSSVETRATICRHVVIQMNY